MKEIKEEVEEQTNKQKKWKKDTFEYRGFL